jgi:anti-sigma-K factor RskA
MNYDRAELLDRLAAEYVLGSMNARVRSRFNSIQRALPAARQAVYAWEERLMPLARSIPPAQPSAATWKAIERKIGSGAPRLAGARWFGWIKPLMGVAFGVILTLGLVRLYPTAVVPVDTLVQERGILPASYVGLLTDDANNPVVLASSTRHGRIMSIKMLRKVEVPAGKVLQLWALPQDGEPFPLGVVPAEGKSTFQMSDTSQNLLSRVSKLAVSIEDGPAKAGSAPAPFVLTGHCVRLW